MSAGYSPSQGAGGLAGRHRCSPPVEAPSGTPLNVSTPSSTYPRTLPYCVFATAVRGVLHLSCVEVATAAAWRRGAARGVGQGRAQSPRR